MDTLSHIERLLPELRAYARSLCRRDENAQDLVQDAVERALRSASRPARLEEIRPWMFRILRNLQYDELRKRRVRREYLASEKRLLDDIGPGQDTARDVMVRLCFDRLPPDKREVLFLVDIMGLKYDEAAMVMDVPIGTIMSRISRARAALLALVDGGHAPVSKGARKT